jgi:hypothetical protein
MFVVFAQASGAPNVRAVASGVGEEGGGWISLACGPVRGRAVHVSE